MEDKKQKEGCAWTASKMRLAKLGF